MNRKNVVTTTAADAFTEKSGTALKKIGKTTYITVSSFNGNRKRDMTAAFIRLLERDSSSGTE